MTLYHSTGIIAASGGAAAKPPGMVLLTPTSIAHSGTSASIGANGQVTFTAVTSLSLNGVFSATYDNYMISVRTTIASGGQNVSCRFRTSGTDASGTNYTRQLLEADGTGVTSQRSTSQTSGVLQSVNDAGPQGFTVMFYGPFLAQPTAYRSITINSIFGAYIAENAGTHSLSTSYDGITIFPASSSITGALQVYGVRS